MNMSAAVFRAGKFRKRQPNPRERGKHNAFVKRTEILFTDGSPIRFVLFTVFVFLFIYFFVGKFVFGMCLLNVREILMFFIMCIFRM